MRDGRLNNTVSETSWPPSFTLDQERILNLLTGDAFYSDASAALREAVLNAIDAINRRRASDPDLSPQIRVMFNSDDLTLLVSDNGDGMDQLVVSNLFAKIGASAADLESAGNSVGEFGIGVISYFMAANSFTLQTNDGRSKPIGLEFHRMMLAGEPARELEADSEERGTSVTLHIRDEETYVLLMKSFPHWCRDVEGLTGFVGPDEDRLEQGDVLRPTAVAELSTPEWVERAHLAPIVGLKAWDAMSATSAIAVLYRGVFVQEYSIRGLWGIRGSIDVDPKHFRPRLNREGFIGQQFRTEVEGFLRQVHPQILVSMVGELTAALSSGSLDAWDSLRWATLWLSIPRSSEYHEAAARWDAAFRQVPAFEVASDDRWVPMTLNELAALEGPIYVAPLPTDKTTTDVVKGALRLLRNTSRPVIRGLRRDRSWLTEAGSAFASTADLIVSVFANELPELVAIAPNAESILEDLKCVAVLYGGSPSVEVVRIGTESPPVLRLSSRLIINIDHDSGKAILDETLSRNAGRWSLIEITARISHEHIAEVAAAVRGTDYGTERLGLVKRRVLRELLQ